MEKEKKIQKAFTQIFSTSNWLNNLLTRELSTFSISGQQYNILRILNGAYPDPLAMQEVKKRMIEHAPNATRLTDKLIAHGYIERQRCCEDRRVVYVKVTKEGQKVLEEIKSRLDICREELDNNFSETDASQLISLLEKLRGMGDAAVSIFGVINKDIKR